MVTGGDESSAVHQFVTDTEAEALRADPTVLVSDLYRNQLTELHRLLPPPDDDLIREPGRWVWYPWRRGLLHVLGPRGFRRLRLDRNRHKITEQEAAVLDSAIVGIVGASVGHTVALALAIEGVGHLRIADFDVIETTNLNRLPVSLFELGINKTVATARRIGELDPYVQVECLPSGLRDADQVDTFLAGLDLVVDECDSLDVKVLLRERARSAGLPVLMETSDRGILDVERYDLEPQRPVLHGLVGAITSAELAGLPPVDKAAYALRLVDPSQVSTRMAASAIEIAQTVSSWPQLGGDVFLGGATVAAATRRLLLGPELHSGRVRVDLDGLLNTISSPAVPATPAVGHRAPDPAPPSDPIAAVLNALQRAPSAGNAQPWSVDLTDHRLTIRIDPDRTSLTDIAHRGSAVAVGAALFNARAAAAAHGILGPVTIATDAETGLPAATVCLDGADHAPALAQLYPRVLARETNRHLGDREPISGRILTDLADAAEAEGAGIRILTDRSDIDSAATILAAAERVRFLTDPLHRQMISELRWPGDPDPDRGIDVLGLELAPIDLQMLDVLRRPDVMHTLSELGAGQALGAGAAMRIRSGSAIAVVTTPGTDLADYIRGGQAVERVWTIANAYGISADPTAPPFIYAVDDAETSCMTERFAAELTSLRTRFHRLVGLGPGRGAALILRLGHAAAPSTRSRRTELANT